MDQRTDGFLAGNAMDASELSDETRPAPLIGFTAVFACVILALRPCDPASDWKISVPYDGGVTPPESLPELKVICPKALQILDAQLSEDAMYLTVKGRCLGDRR